MFNSFRQLFSRAKAAPHLPTDSTLAYYLSPEGKLSPIGGTKSAFTTYSDMSGWIRQGGTLDGSDAELPNSEDGYAYAVATSVWAYNCVELRARKVADIMRKAGRVIDIASGKAIDDHPLMTGLSAAWHRYRQDLFYEWQYNRCVFGENYTEKVCAEVYTIHIPMALRVINPLQIEPVIERGAIVRFDFQDDSYQSQNFMPDEVSFDRIKDPINDFRGLSPMRRAMSAVNVDMHIMTTTRSHYKNGLKPGIIFSVKDKYFESGRVINDATWNKLVERIRSQGKGTRNANRPLILDMPIDVTKIDPPNLSEQRTVGDDQKERIAAAFRVPVPLVTFGEQRYQLSPEQRQYLYEEVLHPECRHMEMVINADLMPFFDRSGRAKFELDERELNAVIEDSAAKTTMLNSRLINGGMTLNEYRRALNDAPLPNGDVLYLPANTLAVPIDQLGTMQAKPSYLPYSNPQVTVQQAAEIAQNAGVSVPTPPPASTNPASEAPANVVAAAENTAQPMPATQSVDAPLVDITNHPAIIHAKHDSAEDELEAWRKAYRQSGRNKAARFTVYLIREDVQSSIKTALNADDETAIKAAFETARDTLATKAIQATRLQWDDAFNNILEGGRSEDYTRQQFQTQLYRAIRKFGQLAYIDGLTDSGVTIESANELDSEDQQAITALLSTQSAYISDFGATLFNDGIGDKIAEVKVDVWWNKSIMPFYQAGLVNGNANAMFEWTLGDAEHCDTCKAMSGQVHRIRDYTRRGILPQASTLDCNGFNCKCRLVRTNGRARGTWV